MPKIASADRNAHAQALLLRIADAHAAGKQKRADHLTRQYLNSFDAKIVAAEEAYWALRPERRPKVFEVEPVAQHLDAWRGTNEEVRVYLRRKTSNPDDYRTVMEFGFENRLLQYLLLPVLRARCPLHPCQFGTSGGVKAAIKKVSDVLSQGPLWCIELDINNCYPSFDEKKLSSLLPLPKEVTDEVIIAERLNMMSGNINELFGPENGHDWESVLVADVLADARRGIPPGSATSSLIAETMLSSALYQVPPIGDKASYADNMLLMATSESDVVTMEKALRSALMAHPVGLLRPRIKIFPSGEPIEFLGHRLTARDGIVHIEPTVRNQEKFSANVASSIRRLGRSNISSEERVKLSRNLKRYMRSWTAAFSLCDGIEVIANDVDW